MLGKIARTVIGALPFSVRYELFFQSARSLGVTAYEAPGHIGMMTGPLYDQTIAKAYLRSGEWSSDITALFSDFFASRGGGTFFDVGANIGMVTVPLARIEGVRCVAFEPDPGNFRLLSANVAAHGLSSKVEFVNAAVSDRAGELSFSTDPYNSGDHRLSSEGKFRVAATPLDAFASRVQGALAVKIDTQGAEPLVVAGGREVLGRADLIVMEFWPWGMRRMQQSAASVIDFVAGYPKAGIKRHGEPAETVAQEDIRARLGTIDENESNAAVDVILKRRQ